MWVYRRSVRVGFYALLLCAVASNPYVRADEAPKLKSDKLGTIPNVHAHGSTLLCGQPTDKDLAEAKRRGIQVVLTLRQEGEVEWDEKAAVEALGLRFERVGFRDPSSLTDDVFLRARKIMRDAQEQQTPVMLHCGSANRVGAIWMVHRVLDQGVSLEDARREAIEIGLRSPGHQKRAEQYIQVHQK